MQDLFAQTSQAFRPLADRMRPTRLADYRGQTHLLGEDKPLRRAVEQGALHSMIFWGPPGVGKTTLAKMLAIHCDAHFISLSAVMSGVKEIRAAVDEAQQIAHMRQIPTVLFVDEVHRFNKSQQDAFLPYIEDGTFIFVGATTENPSFELNNALLSRARVYLLKTLSAEEVVDVLKRAVNDRENGLGQYAIAFVDDALLQLAQAAEGDARRALSLLEIAVDIAPREGSETVINSHVLADVLAQSARRFDKGGDQYFDMISAFHKSVRGSSPDGALYWYCRMLQGGADPLYIARRLVAIASEDIGNADPRAMQIVLSAWDAFERVGAAEGERAIAQAALYCACAPKSNAVYLAFNQCQQDVAHDPDYEVPLHLRNAPTTLMKTLGYGAEYRYAHNEPNAYAAGEVYLPEPIQARRYYEPSERGLEHKIRAKLEQLELFDSQSTEKRYQS